MKDTVDGYHKTDEVSGTMVVSESAFFGYLSNQVPGHLLNISLRLSV